MKKSIFTIILLSVITFANAQKIFVGGGLGFSMQSGETTTNPATTVTKSPTVTNFSIMPTAGYFLNDKIAVGLQFAVNASSSNNNANPSTTTSNFGWGVSPFARYYCLNINKFSVYGQANLTVGGSSRQAKTGNVTVDGPSVMLIGLNVSPAIQYNLNDKISLFTQLNFLNLGFNHTVTTVKAAGVEAKTSDNLFNLGINTDNAFNTNNIQVGFHVNL